MIAGSPISARASRACSSERTTWLARLVEPDPLHRLAKQLAILGLGDRLGRGADQLDVRAARACRRAASAMAELSAVWPPIVGSSASGRSRSMILATMAGVTGSI